MLNAQGQVKEVKLTGRVIRADGTVEELGTLAHWSSNPFRRLISRLRRHDKNRS